MLISSDSAEKARKLSAELANRLLARMAIISMFFLDGLTGSFRGDYSVRMATPLRGQRS